MAHCRGMKMGYSPVLAGRHEDKSGRLDITLSDPLDIGLSLNLQVYRPEIGTAWMEARLDRLWENGIEGIERYNRLRKVEPMQRALALREGHRPAQCAAAGFRIHRVRPGRWRGVPGVARPTHSGPLGRTRPCQSTGRS